MKVYIIVHTNCRGDEWTNKFSFDFIPFKQLLEKMFKEQEGIDPYEYEISEELEKEVEDFNKEQGYNSTVFEFELLLDTYFCQEDRDTYRKRIDSLDGEGFGVELEESLIGVGISKEIALAHLHSINLGNW